MDETRTAIHTKVCAPLHEFASWHVVKSEEKPDEEQKSLPTVSIIYFRAILAYLTLVISLFFF